MTWQYENRVKFTRIYGLVLGLILALPLLLLGAVMLLPPGRDSFSLIMQFSWFFLGPAYLFGEPHFTAEIGVGPNDLTGLLETILFYAVVALPLSAVIWGFKALKTRRTR
jgi:hypothetical protein